MQRPRAHAVIVRFGLGLGLGLGLVGCPGSAGTGAAGAISAPGGAGGVSPGASRAQRIEVIEQGLAARDDQLRALAAEIAQRDALLAELRQSLEAMAEQNRLAREALEALRDRHTSEAQQLESELGRLAALLTLLDRRLEAQGRVVESLRAHSPVANLERAVPRVEAQVVSVERDAEGRETVLLSAGSGEGVEPDWEFTVQRGEQTIAKVKVDTVGTSVASARVVYRAEGERIREGDAATTRP
jgi:chromosome segregation ATPase